MDQLGESADNGQNREQKVVIHNEVQPGEMARQAISDFEKSSYQAQDQIQPSVQFSNKDPSSVVCQTSDSNRIPGDGGSDAKRPRLSSTRSSEHENVGHKDLVAHNQAMLPIDRGPQSNGDESNQYGLSDDSSSASDYSECRHEKKLYKQAVVDLLLEPSDTGTGQTRGASDQGQTAQSGQGHGNMQIDESHCPRQEIIDMDDSPNESDALFDADPSSSPTLDACAKWTSKQH